LYVILKEWQVVMTCFFMSIYNVHIRPWLKNIMFIWKDRNYLPC
jgi:hypothetical protein